MSIIKTRMKTLITSRLQKDKSVSEDQLGSLEQSGESDFTSSTHENRSTPLVYTEREGNTDEVIEKIAEEYFEETSSTTSQYELKSLGNEDINMESLENRILTLKQQDSAVYRKIYDSVYKNYTAYVQELENVTALELSLTEATRTCVNSRRLLRDAERGVATGGLGLLVKHKKRERLKVLLEVLRKFRTLQKARDRLKELLEEGDYPSATQLCIECQQAIETYKQFTCVNQLAVSLADIHTVIENELEQALYSIAAGDTFDSHKYQLVYEAHRILGKSERAIDLLLLKFTTVIHDKTFAVIASTISKASAGEVSTKAQYPVLCKKIQPEHFIECLLELCKEVWLVMCNYYKVRKWHDEYNISGRQSEEDHSKEREIKFNRSYIKQKLESGLLKLWTAIQQRVKPCLEACNMSYFQYDNFIKVLNIINQLIHLGVQFSGVGSDQLKESMRQQSLSYFRHYHKGRLDELRLFLENEQWVLCPVRPSFNVTSLREFKFMRAGFSMAPTSPLKQTNQRIASGDVFTSNINPFSDNNEEEELEDVVMDPSAATYEDTNSDDDKDADESAELRKSYVDESAGSNDFKEKRRVNKRPNSASLRGPVLANVTLTVIRFTGNYMQMMNVLEPIAYDALQYLTHLFDYYLYAVYSFFVSDLCSQDTLSAKLIRSVQRINETIVSNQLMDVSSPNDSFKVPPPVTNPFLQLDNPASLFGTSFRIVALESLVFLAKQFEDLMPQLEPLIPAAKRNFLTQFYSQTVGPCHDLKRPVYTALGAKSIPFDQILPQMSSVKWDIKEIMSQHSKYVDHMLNEFDRFNEMLSYIDKQVPIPQDSLTMLWDSALKSAAEMFVEGFSQAKKCSNEGRALMQLDFQQFRTKMEKMSMRRPLPHHDLVENYIRAYYMSETDLEGWLSNNKSYTTKQLQSLVVCGAGGHLNKKTKQRLMSVIVSDD